MQKSYRDQRDDMIEDFFATSRKAPAHFDVRPRFTPGSPASVSMNVALRVAADERQGYKNALAGRYGDDLRHEAEHKGMAGIVCLRRELPRGKGWDTLDLCTLERTEEPFNQEKQA